MASRGVMAARRPGELAGLVVGVAWIGLALASPPAQLEPPNILLISIDCLNQRQLEEGLVTGGLPAFKALAAESLMFRRAYSHAPWTTPAHSSLLTGLYPTQHGRSLPWGLMIRYGEVFEETEEFPTLAELLSRAGHEAVAFAGQGSMSPRFGLDRGFRDYRVYPKNENGSDLAGARDAFLAWLRARPGSSPPFFAFLHTFDLHLPRPQGAESVEEALRHLDTWISEVIGGLHRAGLYESTAILLTGDHGSEMIVPEGRCCVHGAGHYEENLKVPLLVKLPQGDDGRAGQRRGRIDSLARHVDVLPTVLDLVGIPSEGTTGPGASLLEPPGEGDWEQYSFSEADGRCVRRFALVGVRYKYILTPRDRAQESLRRDARFLDKACLPACETLPPKEELFDLLRDPGERVDLLRGSIPRKLRQVLRRFRQAMAEHRGLRPQYRREATGGESPLDPELEASLRALGYL